MSLLSGNFRVVGSNPYIEELNPQVLFRSPPALTMVRHSVCEVNPSPSDGALWHPSSAVARAFLRPRTLHTSCGQSTPPSLSAGCSTGPPIIGVFGAQSPPPTAHLPVFIQPIPVLVSQPTHQSFIPSSPPISKHPIPNFPRRTYQPRLIEAWLPSMPRISRRDHRSRSRSICGPDLSHRPRGSTSAP